MVAHEQPVFRDAFTRRMFFPWGCNKEQRCDASCPSICHVSPVCDLLHTHAHRLVYFIDDMNMPLVDKYDTQSAIELARQLVDYRGWYDKAKIMLKEVLAVQYVAAMNPTAGSFNITPRMQRHFVTFAVQMPSPDIVRSIYHALLDGHLAAGGFEPELARCSGRLVDATIELHRAVRQPCTPRPLSHPLCALLGLCGVCVYCAHVVHLLVRRMQTHATLPLTCLTAMPCPNACMQRQVMNTFLPSAVKFHYQFNLREMSNIIGGLCRMTRDAYKTPLQVRHSPCHSHT
jgi:P-loop containing dynein motor region/AAA+ lid domain